MNSIRHVHIVSWARWLVFWIESSSWGPVAHFFCIARQRRPGYSLQIQYLTNNLDCFIHVFQILADRGFTLQEDFALLGVSLITPAFTKGRKQLSGREVEESRVKSNVRIHIGKLQEYNFTCIQTSILWLYKVDILFIVYWSYIGPFSPQWNVHKQ